MALDHEICGVAGCTVHTGLAKENTPISVRNEQIKEDWVSGDWTLDELVSFWGTKPESIVSIVRGLKIKA